MAEDLKCAICDWPPVYVWTDTHGVAQCARCGAPYRVYHYDYDKRVEKPAECLIAEASLPLFRSCWESCNSPMSAVWLSLSFPGGQGVATDGRAFDKCFAEMEAARG